jgi:hypothetical protein
MESQISLPYISQGPDGPLHLDAKLTRAKFQRMTSDLLYRCQGPFRQVIRDAGIKIDAIHDVVLVGGSTRMPAVVDLVKSLTGGKEPNTGVNPDEVVAVGACLQAGLLKGEVRDFLLLDVSPASLGIETGPADHNVASGQPVAAIGGAGGVFTKLIERNTTTAITRSKIFTTAVDNQPLVQISVFQGERETAINNRRLGGLFLTVTTPAPRGVPRIEVTFYVDVNGFLEVSAQNLDTAERHSMQMADWSALPKGDIEKMIRDAEQYAEEDRRRREEAEIRNQALLASAEADEPPMLAGHVFISYVRENSAEVDRLHRELEAAGLRVWRDTVDLWPGQNWRTKIRRAIVDDALVFLACFSTKSVARQKSYQNEEITLAIGELRRRKPDESWLIPVRFDDCKIPEWSVRPDESLGSIQRVDLFGEHLAQNLAKLVTAVQQILNRHASP